MTARPRRSCLTVPASSAHMLAKAAALPADEVIVDLEDGVAVDAKGAARDNLGAAAALGTLAIRINGVGTPWWSDDLTAVAAVRPDVVAVPKVESAEEIAAVAARLPSGIAIEAQIETARGLVEVERIAAADAPLEALVFGPGDFAASLGVPLLTIGAGYERLSGDVHLREMGGLLQGERLEPVPVTVFGYALARISVAAHAYGLQAVDGPYADLRDLEGLRRSASLALAHGFDGKWVVHPDQIEPVNEVFTPTPEQVERARRILAAADGAVLVDGEMVDAATKRLAEAVLARTTTGVPPRP